MIEKDALRLFGKQLGKVMPVQTAAPLPSELLRLLRELDRSPPRVAPIRYSDGMMSVK